MFAYELARKLSGSGVKVNAVCPGKVIFELLLTWAFVLYFGSAPTAEPRPTVIIELTHYSYTRHKYNLIVNVLFKYNMSQQESRAIARNRAMSQLFFSVLSSPTAFTTSLRVAKPREPGLRAPNVLAQNRI